MSVREVRRSIQPTGKARYHRAGLLTRRAGKHRRPVWLRTAESEKDEFMANTGRTSQDALSTSSRDLRITGESMGEFLPGEPQALPSRPEITDVVIQLFTHRSVTEP